MSRKFLATFYFLAIVAVVLLASLREPEVLDTHPVPSGVPSAPVGVTSTDGASEPVIPERTLAPPSPSPMASPSLIVKPNRTATPTRANRIVVGVASTYGPGYAGLTALPEGPGHRVRICGTVLCVVRISNDAGPSKAMQKIGRVVDLDVATFERVCACRWTTGLIHVSVEYLK